MYVPLFKIISRIVNLAAETPAKIELYAMLLGQGIEPPMRESKIIELVGINKSGFWKIPRLSA